MLDIPVLVHSYIFVPVHAMGSAQIACALEAAVAKVTFVGALVSQIWIFFSIVSRPFSTKQELTTVNVFTIPVITSKASSFVA